MRSAWKLSTSPMLVSVGVEADIHDVHPSTHLTGGREEEEEMEGDQAVLVLTTGEGDGEAAEEDEDDEAAVEEV